MVVRCTRGATGIGAEEGGTVIGNSGMSATVTDTSMGDDSGCARVEGWSFRAVGAPRSSHVSGCGSRGALDTVSSAGGKTLPWRGLGFEPLVVELDVKERGGV